MVARFLLLNTFILGLSFVYAPLVQASESSLRITVNIVQCGPRIELPKACDADSRCCALLEKFETAQNDVSNSAGSFIPASFSNRNKQALFQTTRDDIGNTSGFE